ncbi:hypothetical protein LEP1GSC038_1310 [Leptospira weilii str. 2006001855]|uniref:Uncharacterized protein n=3 Tax=Leptospira weilii TaxID=28184 RepID=M6FD77_9LEPT|nr:hypothetical protein LEP1GSC038_1310 [Leptospira weilii str. 2006001855]OMI16393.1 hypothetical protein BUQ74_15610 [Leptospira weilii serovar Heyan]
MQMTNCDSQKIIRYFDKITNIDLVSGSRASIGTILIRKKCVSPNKVQTRYSISNKIGIKFCIKIENDF